MDNINYLQIILLILTIEFLLERTLEYLNLKNQTNDLPRDLENIYDKSKFEAAQAYFKVNSKFNFITSTFGFLITIIAFVAGFFGGLDLIVRESLENPIFISIVYFGILFFLSDIMNLPFSLYKTFVIEEKFGFNKTTIKTFVTDKIKSYLLAVIVGGIILFLLLSLILRVGENFWIYFWVVLSLLTVFLNMFYTSLIVPIFNRLKPLEDGPLKSSIQEYSLNVHFPLHSIYVIDGSKRSSKANAFFSGIGSKKKIVLYDTLINNHTIEELVAVLAHEVGHYKKKHVLYNLFLSIIQTGAMLWLLSKFIFNTDLSIALGATELSIHLNLIVFGILFSPISHFTGLFLNFLSRKNEYEADDFAAITYNSVALSDALKKLSSNNLSNLTPHPLYVFWNYSHPPLLARLKNLQFKGN